MNISPITARLDPLIRRLASSSDGEIVNCVRLIRRQLDKVGASWNDLADLLTADPGAAAEDDTLPVFSNCTAAVEWLLAPDCGDLTAREIEFLESMRGILREWPPKPKQARWIEALVERRGRWFDG